MLEDLGAAVLGLLLVLGSVLDNFLTLLVGLVLVILSVHSLALILVDVLDDVVDNVPLPRHILRLHLVLLGICSGPGPLAPIRNDSKHEVLLGGLVILHLALFEYLLVLELVVSVHDALSAHDDVDVGHALALHSVVHVVFIIVVVALLSLVDIIQIVHTRRASSRCLLTHWPVVSPASSSFIPLACASAITAPRSLCRSSSTLILSAGVF